MTAISIDRETRDFIVDRLRSYEVGEFETFNDDLRLCDRDEISEKLEYVNWFCGFLDQTDGWGCADEGDADEREVTVDDRLVAFVAKWQSDLADNLRCDLRQLKMVAEGNQDYYHPGKSQAETIAFDAELIERDKAEIAINQRLLDRLIPEAVA